MGDVIYINFEEGAKRVMNNTKLYVKLLTKFKNDTNLNDLDAALTANDMEKAQVAAHTMKGLAANLSLTELYKQSMELESQIKAKSVNPEQTTALKNTFAQTLTEIEKVIAQND
ncbi:MAG: Hpt domain-containing protein [Treponema sp.]|jgi:HPt (histidine-containing phosphotransfer) domain-containing protein|nr:Hpt domain-containing protein [Treponema sp.]